MAAIINANKKEWILKKETEIRCEVPEQAVLTIKLISGTAELFGVELAANKDYSFKDQNIAIFTWYGCTIESSGADDALYVADSTPMVAYVNTHVQLEARRDVALANSDFGPRVMIVGPSDHGKSSTAQILATYAVRLDRTPIFIDLDVSLGLVGIPGCIGAIPLDKTTLHVEEGFSNYNPLIYFAGMHNPKDNIEQYKTLISILANKVNERLDRDIDARASGIIINTCAWVDGGGFDIKLIMHCVQVFAIDVILVMGQDKLYSNLSSSVNAAYGGGNNNNIVVVKLPRSGGVVNRDANVRKRLRKTRIKEYFYGRPHSTLSISFSPERRENVTISSFIFLKLGGIQLTQGMRLIGDTSNQDTSKLIRIQPSTDLDYSVIGVLHNPNNGFGDLDKSISNDSSLKSSEISQNILASNIAGFVSIVQVDIDNDRMTILCPCPGSLPSNYLLVGGIKWVE
eukprot:gene7434-10130_t